MDSAPGHSAQKWQGMTEVSSHLNELEFVTIGVLVIDAIETTVLHGVMRLDNRWVGSLVGVSDSSADLSFEDATLGRATASTNLPDI